ncbi:hypothetical protein V1514DRAFT_318968 [Lipomyces japonicus]|uniref:uncharacterized protein n=1 Tax=Lipomyces japonicus TaxID=56871 RepID=UPI0034CE392E
MLSSELELITSGPLTPSERARRTRDFGILVSQFEPWERTVSDRDDYNPITLLRVMKAELEKSGRFLRYLFAYLSSELSIKASVGRTPDVARPSELVDPEPVEGVSHRMRALRELCLTSDHHGCVVTRRFDKIQFGERGLKSRGHPRNDYGNRSLGEQCESGLFTGSAHYSTFTPLIS